MTAIYSRSAVKERIMARSAVVEQSSTAFERMIEEAVILHKAQRFESAIEKNVDLVACLEGNAKTHKMEVSGEVHAMAVHNLGSALHQMGHFEVAKGFYSEAITELSTAEKDPFDFIWKMFGDVRASQLDFMKHKVTMADAKQIPKSTVYLNGSGEEVEWSEDEINKAKEEAAEIEKKDEKERPKVSETQSGPGGLPKLNMSAAANMGTSYPITSTPRKELW